MNFDPARSFARVLCLKACNQASIVKREALSRTRCVRVGSLALASVLLLTSTSWAQNSGGQKPQDAAPQAQNVSSMPAAIYGKWYTYPAGNPNTDPIRHEFRHDASGGDEMIVTRACPVEAHVVTAKVASPIEVSADQIRVLKSALDSQPLQGTAVCEVSITAAAFSYSFSEDGQHLILTNPGGNPDYLELARDTEASETPVQQRLYGTWVVPPLNGKDMRVQVRWVFYRTAERQDKVRQIAVCTRGTESVVADVDASMTVTKDHITITESASHDERQGDVTCTASLGAGTWRYTLAPNGVTLTLLGSAGGKPMTLTREDQPGLN
jgi:hypothetical protein